MKAVMAETLSPERPSVLYSMVFPGGVIARAVSSCALGGPGAPSVRMLATCAQDKLSPNQDLDRRLRFGGGDQVVQHGDGKDSKEFVPVHRSRLPEVCHPGRRHGGL